MSFYSDIAGTAQQIIREFGATGTITKVTQGAYDNATSTAAVTTVAASCIAVVFPGAGYRYVDGSQVLNGDYYALVAANITPPSVGDSFEFAGVTRAIIKASILAPAGTNVIYELGLRG